MLIMMNRVFLRLFLTVLFNIFLRIWYSSCKHLLLEIDSEQICIFKMFLVDMCTPDIFSRNGIKAFFRTSSGKFSY